MICLAGALALMVCQAMAVPLLLLIPPMTQLNTPYPSTAYLTGFLRSRGIDARQADPAIELILRLFSQQGLKRVEVVLQGRARLSPSAGFFLSHAEQYQAVSGSVLRFLQGKDPSLALRIISRELLPEGPRFAAIEQMDPASHSGD